MDEQQTDEYETLADDYEPPTEREARATRRRFRKERDETSED